MDSASLITPPGLTLAQLQKPLRSGGCKGCSLIARAERDHEPFALLRPVVKAAQAVKAVKGLLASDEMPAQLSSPSQPPLVSPSALLPPDLASFPHVQPALLHTLKHNSSVLALAVSSELQYVFAGTQDGEIVVWSLDTFRQICKIQAHRRSVLCLFMSPDGKYLISSAGDAFVNVWCPRTLKRIAEIYSTYDVGDIFSVAYSPQHDTVYFGAQNTTIQWVKLNDANARVGRESASHPARRNHRFFDSKPVGGTSTPRRTEERWNSIPPAQNILEVNRRCIRQFAHFGYVYCMLMAKGPTVHVDTDEEVLISGGGDGTIKLWRQNVVPTVGEYGDDGLGIEEIMTLGEDDAESVMSLAIDESFLYAGKLDGQVELWDLDTKQRLRVMEAHSSDVMSLQMGWGCLWSAAANGSVAKHSTVHYGQYHNQQPHVDDVAQKYHCITRWKAHEGKILASAVSTHKSDRLYIAGGNDNNVSVWRVRDFPTEKGPQDPETDLSKDAFFGALSEFVSYRTVSSSPEFSEDCHKGATFLAGLFKKMGAKVNLLNTQGPHNSVVLATLSGKKEPAQDRKRILFYGHYDVVAADTRRNKSNWNTDPFEMKGDSGYLYGRGVSDNKGPIIAALFAVADLMQKKALENDIVFLIEGEEESGSAGFQDAVKRNKHLIGPVDYVLLANSYWLDDEVPCLTYGLRGVLHANVCVDSPFPNRHSGVDGSYMNDEPLSDLTCVLAQLKGPKNRVMIKGFYDRILPTTADEEERFAEIVALLTRKNQSSTQPTSDGFEASSSQFIEANLKARWREPNLTIHRYKVSGPDGSLVSSHASANISLRLVPGQEVDEVIASLVSFLEERFSALGSRNSFSVQIDNRAEPWLGDPSSPLFRTLEKAVIAAWTPVFEEQDCGTIALDTTTASVASKDQPNKLRSTRPKWPLYIREGGSIPAIRFLEKEFEAPAAHLPCGQASDSAHLDNEKMRMLNLVKAREILGIVFKEL
ncbi:putative di- and tripeptidase DUG2 [Ceratocystis fimbriata CBS 114723]|uniref:Putative di-and tripeptidase DUG2 n=1 Tax=Ceratocystis fimbriata CBS 114723 TaxID=1035309 RepID=A0A2C5WW42_9PEZI|nr:putative di- and tripeptidase DUG2 [Ceratocystis fimbriata CBS 114723]